MHNKIDEMVLTVPLGNSTTVEIVESQEKVLSVNEVCKIANISRKHCFITIRLVCYYQRKELVRNMQKCMTKLQSINCSRFKCTKMLVYYYEK